MMKLTCKLFVRTWRKLRVGMQRGAFKLTSTVRLLSHYAGSVIAVSLDNDSCDRAEVQIPKLMARRERCD